MNPHIVSGHNSDLDCFSCERRQDDSPEILPGRPRRPRDDPEDGEARGQVLLEAGARGIATD